MNGFYITFRSVTYAQRAQGVLREAGIGTVLSRTPRELENRGCGYRLQLREDPKRAVQLLRKAGVDYRRVFTADGQEVTV